jgi:hypothetical protein
MKLQARQSILDMWQAAVDYSYTKESTWNWGGRRTPNCIGDAEQLLILLYPATTISSLALEAIEDDRTDVIRALRKLGGGRAIPRAIIRGTREYLLRYRNDDGNPLFSGGSYFQALGEDSEAIVRQRKLDVVDAYSMSLTLCLAILGFIKMHKPTLTGETVLAEVAEVEELASRRLSAAMVGLLRSFAVHTFDPDSEAGASMLAMVNQARTSPEAAVRTLNRELDSVWVALRLSLADGLTESQKRLFEDFSDSSRLFECGWSWGVIDGTPEVDYAREYVPFQPDGVAEERPNTYFTVSAMDGIRDLFSQRTRVLGLLTVEQQRLAQALQNRLNVTQQFWAKLATFGEAERWPIEDVPWRTTDGSESDYYSLLLSAIVVQTLGEESGSGPKLRRVSRLLEELAMRAKITRRPVENDPAVALHLPGMTMSLGGSEKLGDECIGWVVSSFSMLLLKQMMEVAARIENSFERAELLLQADKIWEHLQLRRLTAGEGRELWDAPGNLYRSGDEAEHRRPSWYHTERAMEALVRAAQTVTTEAIAGSSLISITGAVLAEAENLLDRELLRGAYTARHSSFLSEEDGVSERLRETLREIQANLRRSRVLQISQPATAMALAHAALRDLDVLAATRQRH